jgi:IS1 family transposase
LYFVGKKIKNELGSQWIALTDFWQGYRVLESEKHVAAVGNEREKGVANHIERFNNTLRQRCSRLALKHCLFQKN